MVRRRFAGERLHLTVEGATLERLLAEAGSAVCELLAAGPAGGRPDRLPVQIRARDPERLLAGFLDDLLQLAHAEDFRATRIERLEVDETGLRAAVPGRTAAGDAAVPRVIARPLTARGGPWRAEIELGP